MGWDTLSGWPIPSSHSTINSHCALPLELPFYAGELPVHVLCVECEVDVVVAEGAQRVPGAYQIQHHEQRNVVQLAALMPALGQVA